jgi:WD40 repeat protein
MDRTAILWDLDSGKAVRVFRHLRGNGFIRSVAFSPDGKQILTGTGERSATLWEVASGAILHEYTGQTGQVFSSAFRPDGSQVVFGSNDGTAFLWDGAAGRMAQVFRGPEQTHNFSVDAVVFGPEGSRVLGASNNRLILWDAATGGQIRDFVGSFGAVRSAAFSPDGNQVMGGYHNGSVFVWETTGGKLLRTISPAKASEHASP